jgi:Holliday junction resolvasome RuvABC endonuclease subunit
MTILGLDLAIHCGYSVCQSGQIIASGVWDFSNARKNGHNGHLFTALSRHIDDLCICYKIDHICYERSHFRGGASTRIGVGMSSTVLEYCASNNIPVSDIPTLTLKKWATGTGKADKAMMMAEAEKRTGKHYESDDEADAVLISLSAHEKLV